MVAVLRDMPLRPRHLSWFLPCLASACTEQPSAPRAAALHLEPPCEIPAFEAKKETGFEGARVEPPAMEPPSQKPVEPQIDLTEEPVAAPPGAAPRFDVVDEEYAIGGCSFAVRGHGFPAVALGDDARPAAAVTVLHPDQGNADEDVAPMTLRWHDREGRVLRTHVVYDGAPIGEATHFGEDASACARERERITQSLDSINVELAAGYRPMKPLELTLPPAPWMEPDEPAIDRSQPMVEVLYRRGWLIFRVPGVEVLERQPHVDWRQYESDFSESDPRPVAVWHDPDTRLAVVDVSYSTGGCLSDDTVYPNVITLSPRVIEEVEQRSGWCQGRDACDLDLSSER